MPQPFASIGGREWRRGVKGQIGSRFASNRPAFCVKSSDVLRQNAPRFASNQALVLRQIGPSFCVKSRKGESLSGDAAFSIMALRLRIIIKKRQQRGEPSVRFGCLNDYVYDGLAHDMAHLKFQNESYRTTKWVVFKKTT